jgi:aspartyl/asparaginyl-tRNA synthetase
MQFLKPSLRITYKEGLALLKAEGVNINFGDDLTTAQERTLGKIIHDK